MVTNKENRVTIRITDEELELLKKAADRDDRTVSSFVRTYAIRVAKDEFGVMRDLQEQERILAKKEELLHRKMKLDQEQFVYDNTDERGNFDPDFSK